MLAINSTKSIRVADLTMYFALKNFHECYLNECKLVERAPSFVESTALGYSCKTDVYTSNSIIKHLTL